MIILMIFCILLYMFLILEHSIFPWYFIDNSPYNIFGINKYGETRQQRMVRFKYEVKRINNDEYFQRTGRIIK